MTIYPVFLDARPAYLAPLSLAAAPVAGRTLLERVRACVAPLAPEEPTVWSADAAADTGGSGCTPLEDLLERCEPSDWVLLLDLARPPLGHLPLAELRRATADPRCVLHVVTMNRARGGAEERVCLDSRGRVQRIQRYYAGVTAIQVEAVPCTLLSGAAAGRLAAGRKSLLGLREAAARLQVPARDLVLSASVPDLWDATALLELSAQTLLRERGAALSIAPSARVHASARLYGPVLIEAGAVVSERATIVGPAVLGHDCRVGAEALVAQCVLLPHADVADGAELQHAVCGGSEPTAEAGCGAISPPYLDEPARPELRRWYFVAKRAVDAGLAVLALLLLSPLLLAIALLIRLTTRGPVFFGDWREGRAGRVFRCWKFRTMVADAARLQRRLYARNQVDGPQFKLARDHRVTPVGRWLRATNLDELPQLFNVARGEMSLIGPRPSPFRENQICVPWRRARLSVRPGITGLWQVCRDARTCGDFHQWICYDTLYVRHLSLTLDFKILAATLLSMGGQWSVPLRWLIPHPRLSSVPEDLLPTGVPLLDLRQGPRLPEFTQDNVEKPCLPA